MTFIYQGDVQDGGDQTVVMDVEHCARCGENHEHLQFSKLRQPSKLREGDMTHWTLCPNTLEPLMFIVFEVPDNTKAVGDC